ncbi:hypothetical protein [Niabella drilacis]|uniref:Outer membrane protein beta-barrel domain-containing protein n=1 Tax=Niabella drilacis (strain DSM 25811 / CCM 8410 / CCUG 62505 / LMG 26954 / E90) TaxID=1285928 RepID=A0A1G6Z2Z2_NIADE|nr:hypothetical protein [Niabella drilacis]SDD96225.1 hypothetical protein SAMN04487894_11712 [Niabella drilacis]
MRNILLALLFVMALLPAAAQDRIYSKRPPKVVAAQVTEIDIEFIKYRKSDNPDGPVYRYPKKYVDSIVYANGSADYFSSGRQHRPITRQKALQQREYEKMGSGTFIATAGVFDLVQPDLEYNAPENMRNRPSAALQLSYERTLLNNRLGLDVAPFVGLNDGAWGLGFAMRFYPKNKGRVRLGLGPQYIFSSKKAVTRYRVTDNNNPSFTYASDAYVRELVRFSSLGFTGKLTVNVNRVLCLAGNFGVGGIVGGRASEDRHPDHWKLQRNNVCYYAGLGAGIRF